MRPAELTPYFLPITTLSGVGEAMAMHLTRLLGTMPKVPSLRDLVFHLPSGWITRQVADSIATAPTGIPVVLRLTVLSHHSAPRLRQGRKPPSRVVVSDGTDEIVLVFFQARPDQLAKQLPVGQVRMIGGVLEPGAQGLQMVHPDLITRPEELRATRPEPIYPLTAGVTSRQLARMVPRALDLLPELPEWQDEALKQSRAWPDFHAALSRLHGVTTELEEPNARARLAYDELLASQLALGMVRAHTKRLATAPLVPKDSLRARLLAALPFTLTKGQQEVIAEIDADLASGQRMQRLLQGDVGSGKTLVALMAMLRVVEAGGQAALMAPTEILARQHAKAMQKLCEPLGLITVLLTGTVKGAERNAALAAIAEGKAAIVLGTQSLFQESVEFANLQLVIIDEQHRFGVAQRLALSEKAHVPHLLLMTATPIPRSLAMTAFGDMDSSALREKPPGRQPIATRAIPQSRLGEVLAALARAMAEGNKVYWICPLVEENDDPMAKTDLAAAETRHREFLARFGSRVALVHGRMKPAERNAAMAAFAGNEADLLVATTVVEVGVDVPEATIIVIEHAERFGLAQLHQLRGRVGRGSRASSCILLYGERLSDYAKSRLRVMRDTEDGFKIAEEDLRLRGPGEILGTRQSGLPEFQFADLSRDADLVAIARDDVKLQLHRDPHLKEGRGLRLRSLLYLFRQDAMARYLAGG